MSREGGVQNSSGSYRHAQVGACASFSYVGGVLANQASIEARSYSDLGPSTTINRNFIKRAGNGNNTYNNKEALDMVFYEQYNNYYGVIEGEEGAPPHYYPCSNVEGRGGVGSWSMRILDPEVKRKGRLASYRAISFEGKMKSSMRKSFKWLKHKCFSLLSSADGGHGGAGDPPG